MQFYDYEWLPYVDNRMRNKATLSQQLKLKYHTYLDLGQQGGEVVFIPTKVMSNLHSEIMELYKKIKTTNNRVEINNEVYFTTKIEGAHTTFQRTVEIHDGSPIDGNNYTSEMMVKGGFEATKYLNLCGYELTEDKLLTMWNLLVDGCCQNLDVRGNRYRIGPIYVGNHAGMPWQQLEDIMSYWIRYYNSNQLDDYPFIKAALLHVSYEMIHPFCDGNGRSGRLLMINYLISRGYDKCRAISFSQGIAQQAQGYYYNLDLSDNTYLDCTPFIEYMLYVFRDTFSSVVNHTRDEMRQAYYDKNTGQYYIMLNNQRWYITEELLCMDEAGSTYVLIDNRKYNILFSKE